MSADGKEKPTLSFSDVYVDIQNKRVLRDVTGTARRGEILAVMGPSGTHVVVCARSNLTVPAYNYSVTLQYMHD